MINELRLIENDLMLIIFKKPMNGNRNQLKLVI